MELTEEEKNIKYENRVTIFIDILGFRKIIKDTVNAYQIENERNLTHLNAALLFIKEYFDIKDNVSKSMQTSQFSDCIVISFKGDEKGEIYSTLADIQTLIIILLVDYKIICRGGISYGKLIQTKSFLDQL